MRVILSKFPPTPKLGHPKISPELSEGAQVENRDFYNQNQIVEVPCTAYVEH